MSDTTAGKGDDRQAIIELRRRLAEYVLAVDLLSRMAESVGEAAVVEEMFELFVELCAPAHLSYTPIVAGLPGETVRRGVARPGAEERSVGRLPAKGHALAAEGDGFTLRLDRGSEILGVLRIDRIRFPENLDDYVELALEIADLLALVVSNARMYDAVAHLSATDQLTDLPNRRSCFERLDAEFAKCLRQQGSFVVAMFDLDHFKKVNDSYGHHAGDAVLREAAQRMRSRLRQYDVIARVGGEEFLLIAPDTDLRTGEDLAERMRRCITDSAFDIGGLSIAVTVSCGVTAASADDATVEALVARADRCLYEAKRAGRNRVVAKVAGPVDA